MSDSIRDQLLGMGFKPAPKPERKPDPRKPGPGTSVVVHLPLAASQTPSQKDVLDTKPISLESP